MSAVSRKKYLHKSNSAIFNCETFLERQDIPTNAVAKTGANCCSICGQYMYLVCQLLYISICISSVGHDKVISDFWITFFQKYKTYSGSLICTLISQPFLFLPLL